MTQPTKPSSLDEIYNLEKITNKFAKNIADAQDSALFGYVSAAVRLLEAQGKDITQYAIINVSNPMEYSEWGVRATSQYRVVPISDLKNLPTYSEEDK